MSVVWFLFLFWIYNKGIEVSEIAFLIVGIFYIGDCVLAVRSEISKISDKKNNI